MAKYPRTGNRDTDLALKEIIDKLELVERAQRSINLIRTDKNEHRLEMLSRDGKASSRIQVNDGEFAETLTRDIDARGFKIYNLKRVESEEVASSKGSVYLGNDIHLHAGKGRMFITSPDGAFEISLSRKTHGPTTSRPSSPSVSDAPYFDTTIGKPVWYDGSGWVDATGTTA